MGHEYQIKQCTIITIKSALQLVIWIGTIDLAVLLSANWTQEVYQSGTTITASTVVKHQLSI